MNWPARATLGVLLLLLSVAVGPAIAGSVVDGQTADVSELDPDLTVIEVAVEENGTAVVSVEYARHLQDGAAQEDFQAVVKQIESNRSATREQYAEELTQLISTARSVDRSMTVRNVTVSARTSPTLGDSYGVVRYSATWTNFAKVEDGQLRVGDALSGVFLGDDTTLYLSYPDTYRPTRVTPTPSSKTEGRLAWEGPRQFERTQPQLVLEPADSAPGTPTGAASEECLSWVPVVVSAIGVFILFAWVFHERETAMTATQPATEPRLEPTTDDPSPPSELLSNEEQVVRFLETAGGRAKQQEIVEALGWTEAKTSQVLSDMTDTGTVEKFRIGRENVVKLADAEEVTDPEREPR